MRFEKSDDFCGTCLQGHVNVSYKRLVEVFGEPHCDGDGYKVDAEWCFEFEDGTIATIYNYKDGKNYNGDMGLDVSEIRDWHVGGRENKALALVREVLG